MKSIVKRVVLCDVGLSSGVVPTLLHDGEINSFQVTN